MEFYFACYKRQIFDEKRKVWRDTDYKNQRIVVIARNRNEAKAKIEDCLEVVEKDCRRAVLTSDVLECGGLYVTSWVDYGYATFPVEKEKVKKPKLSFSRNIGQPDLCTCNECGEVMEWKQCHDHKCGEEQT